MKATREKPQGSYGTVETGGPGWIEFLLVLALFVGPVLYILWLIHKP